MACANKTAPVYSPEQVTQITQRYYNKGFLFRRGKIARQMRAVREQCPTARAMDDAHRERDQQVLASSLLVSSLTLLAIGFCLNQEARRLPRLPALSPFPFPPSVTPETGTPPTSDGDCIDLTEAELGALIERAMDARLHPDGP